MGPMIHMETGGNVSSSYKETIIGSDTELSHPNSHCGTVTQSPKTIQEPNKGIFQSLVFESGSLNLFNSVILFVFLLLFIILFILFAHVGMF